MLCIFILQEIRVMGQVIDMSMHPWSLSRSIPTAIMSDVLPISIDGYSYNGEDFAGLGVVAKVQFVLVPSTVSAQEQDRSGADYNGGDGFILPEGDYGVFEFFNNAAVNPMAHYHVNKAHQQQVYAQGKSNVTMKYLHDDLSPARTRVRSLRTADLKQRRMTDLKGWVRMLMLAEDGKHILLNMSKDAFLDTPAYQLIRKIEHAMCLDFAFSTNGVEGYDAEQPVKQRRKSPPLASELQVNDRSFFQRLISAHQTPPCSP
jgi:hypothetical protein